MAGRKSKRLSPEDKELWSRVTQSAKPIRGYKTKGAVAHDQPPPPPLKTPLKSPAKPVAPTGINSFRIGERASDPDAASRLSPSLSEHLASAPVTMDHGKHRQMKRGKLTPEARVDLHGMTLAEAHPRLIRFILDAQAAGKRLVLVITGKGKDRDDPGPIPIRRGVLRHQVPGWLRAPPLGAYVLEIREAHLRHGGAGALYVYLRRAR